MPTVTELVAQAMLDELKRRRAYLDAAESLASVTVTVRLQESPELRVRAVEFTDHRIVAKRGGGRSVT